MRSILFGCAAVAAAIAVAPAPAQAQFAGPLVAAPDASNRTSVLTRDWRNLNRWRDLQHRYGWVDLFAGRLGDGQWALDNTLSPELQGGSSDWWRVPTERRFPR